MNMFARFDENPAMTLRVIKETKRYGRTDARTDNVKTVYPLQTKFAGAIIKGFYKGYYRQNKVCFFEILTKIKSKLESNFLIFFYLILIFKSML